MGYLRTPALPTVKVPEAAGIIEHTPASAPLHLFPPSGKLSQAEAGASDGCREPALTSLRPLFTHHLIRKIPQPVFKITALWSLSGP